MYCTYPTSGGVKYSFARLPASEAGLPASETQVGLPASETQVPLLPPRQTQVRLARQAAAQLRPYHGLGVANLKPTPDASHY